jgi:lipid-A-disaccharide synthase
MSNTPVFAMVVGESSGDILGADLIKALRKRYPNAHFEGVGGPLMQLLGFQSHFEMERLSVMGFVEPLKRLPELLSMRRALIRRYRETPPAAFIGIDSPDFNLQIELSLRQSGIKTIHYVSPSVWAWRQGRIKKIVRCVDLMLTLLPFESDFYRQHQVPVRFVGHPLADQYPLQPDTSGARRALGLQMDTPTLTLMPGSRGSEVDMMAQLFMQVVARVREDIPNLQVLVPAANAARYRQLTALLGFFNLAEVRLLEQQSKLAMEASDVVLLTSGTTALEAMLLKKPMVVSYRLGALTYKIVAPMIVTPFISIPNLLAKRMLVPELIQDDATVDGLSDAVMAAFSPVQNHQLISEFTAFHQTLKLPSGELAAAAIDELLRQ